MPVPFHQDRPIVTQIHSLPSTSSDESGVHGLAAEYARASPALWDRLIARSGASRKTRRDGDSGGVPARLSVAVEWPRDNRLGKGKGRSLVVWVVKATEEDASHASSEFRLLVPPHLLPPYAPTPLRAKVYLHDPIDLSLVLLQPVIPHDILSDSAILDVDDLDLSKLFPDAAPNGMANGTVNGHDSALGKGIFREGEITSLPTRNHGSASSERQFRILMLEPVQQGVLASSTRIIISTTPYHPSINSIADEPVSERASTHASLADFDADAFLSSSLALSLSHSSPLPNGSPTSIRTDTSQSVSSSTSGSITPRPPGTSSPVASVNDLFSHESEVGGTRFTAVKAMGPSSSDDTESDVCWIGVGGLGRAGIFEGDWALLRSASASDTSTSGGRLVRVLAWEQLDEPSDELPDNPILVSPHLHRALFTESPRSHEVVVQPTPFGARQPTLPMARSMTFARMATTEGMDKRYECSWLAGLKAHFGESAKKGKAVEDAHKLVRRGDVFSVPVWLDRSVSEEASGSDSDDSDREEVTDRQNVATAVVYFVVTALSYEPLVPLEEDFRSSVSSKARAGELGCWMDAGEHGSTKMVVTGLEKARVRERGGDRLWHGIAPVPQPFSTTVTTKLRHLLSTCFAHTSSAFSLQLSVLVKGARGSGKSSLIRSLAEEIGLNVVNVECYDIIGDTAALTEGTIKAQLEKAKSCAPSIFLLSHVEGLSRKSESTATGRVPPIVNVLEDSLEYLKSTSGETGWPCVMMGTTADEDAVPPEVLSCFKQDIVLSAPNEAERLAISRQAFETIHLAPDVSLGSIATQTAALQVGDIVSVSFHAHDLALSRAMSATTRSAVDIRHAGLSLNALAIDSALGEARSSYSDSIGAPRIPNVSWDDVGGLASVKREILDTVQLPLERPELFAEGLKKRSGILLYGPPGTGKTLLAKAVATSCSLNFFSVKGPELLNMYIGESEANVRRVFQRARDAQPCVIFLDEIDSVAPKRGNQGDSGGVMDRIVSQLLAELDGMSSGKGGDVYVMGATNRPDLLDPALLRPGRFDRMLYLSVATSHDAQLSIIQALTRKFQLDPDLDLAVISDQCPFNYTGADFYALCSDAMLRAMTRKAEDVDRRIDELNASPSPHSFPHPLTPQYYLSTMAKPEETEVRVGRNDFEEALRRLIPSVSRGEMEHYGSVQREFKGFAINGDGDHRQEEE